MRIIFFAGKGGVGKTTVAAASGVKLAEMGYRTTILSLDVAHSLSDIFDLESGVVSQNRGEPVEVSENLWIQELDIHEELNRNWKEVRDYFSALLNTTGLDEILAEELAILPGMEEISLLFYINRYVKEERFDVIILDCAPTGEAIRFISIPTTLEWYMKRVFKLERTLARYVRPVAKRMTDVPLPGDDYFSSIEHLFERLRGVDKVLSDPEVTSVRLVSNPEKVVLKETQRAFMYFCLYRMNIDAVVMNRLLPADLEGSYLEGWRKSQAAYMELAKEYFSPVPIFPVNLSGGEIYGYERLRSLAEQLYEGADPAERFFEGTPYSLTKEDGDYKLTLRLPFVSKQEVQLRRFSDELTIRIGGFKRNLVLPRQVAASESVSARMEGQDLCIYFKGGGNEQAKG